jgi:hypothetical protein
MPGSNIIGSKGQTIQEVAVGGLGVAGTPAGGVVTVQQVLGAAANLQSSAEITPDTETISGFVFGTEE